MADRETELEWEKSKRIEKERKKAEQALAAEQPDKTNLAFLDHKSTKVKGWSNDSDVIRASVERMGNRAIVLAVAGIVLFIIGYAGAIIVSNSRLGMAGVIISGLPTSVGMISMGIAILMAIITIGNEIINKVKSKRKFGSPFWTSAAAILLVIIFYLIMHFVMRAI